MINLDIIAKELNIGKDKFEKDVEWYRRVVYSAVGRMALATLWNENDKGEISVRSLKRTTYELLKAYESMVPEINSMLDYGECTVMLCDSILSTMESAGFFYHRAEYYRIAKTKHIKMGKVKFCRGIGATESCYMSGLGAYTKATDADEYDESFLNNLEKPQFVLQKLIKSASWRECDFEKEKVEYLKMEEPFKKGYWMGQPNSQFQYSLARTKESETFVQTYYLVKNTSDGMKVAELPTWISEERNHTLLSTALLQRYKRMPCANCSATKDRVEIDATGHKYTHVIQKAQIGKAGREYDKCTTCGSQKNEKTIKALTPQKTALKKLKSGKKAFTVSWTKKAYSGYQIRYSLKSSMKSATYKNVSASKTSLKVKKLKTRKKYYVQIRTYKTVDGKKCYSTWSSAKKVKTK